MKKTERSFNSTLNRTTRLKTKRRIKPISTKRATQKETYKELRQRLIEGCRRSDGEYYSEISGRQISWWFGGEHVIPIELHHIDGRRGERLIDPFNIVACSGLEHGAETNHHTFGRIQELKALVAPIRIAQGFKNA